MKVGVSTLFAIEEKRLLLEAVEALQDNRMRTIELVFEKPHLYSIEEVVALKRLGLDYSAHGPFLAESMEPLLFGLNVPSPSLVERSITIAGELEATCYVMHGGDLSSPEVLEDSKTNEKLLRAFKEKFDDVFKKAADAGIKVLLENTRPNSLFGKMENVARMREAFGIGFCLDISHAEAFKQASSGFEELSKLSPEHVHVSDNNLTADEHLAAGEGKINFRKWFYALKKIGFNGKAVVECTSLKDSVLSVNRLNDLLERLRLK